MPNFAVAIGKLDAELARGEEAGKRKCQASLVLSDEIINGINCLGRNQQEMYLKRLVDINKWRRTIVLKYHYVA